MDAYNLDTEEIKELVVNFFSSDPVNFNAVVNNFFSDRLLYSGPGLRIQGASRFKHLFELGRAVRWLGRERPVILNRIRWDTDSLQVTVDSTRTFAPYFLPFSELSFDVTTILHLNPAAQSGVQTPTETDAVVSGFDSQVRKQALLFVTAIEEHWRGSSGLDWLPFKRLWAPPATFLSTFTISALAELYTTLIHTLHILHHRLIEKPYQTAEAVVQLDVPNPDVYGELGRRSTGRDIKQQHKHAPIMAAASAKPTKASLSTGERVRQQGEEPSIAQKHVRMGETISIPIGTTGSHSSTGRTHDNKIGKPGNAEERQGKEKSDLRPLACKVKGQDERVTAPRGRSPGHGYGGHNPGHSKQGGSNPGHEEPVQDRSEYLPAPHPLPVMPELTRDEGGSSEEDELEDESPLFHSPAGSKLYEMAEGGGLGYGVPDDLTGHGIGIRGLVKGEHLYDGLGGQARAPTPTSSREERRPGDVTPPPAVQHLREREGDFVRRAVSDQIFKQPSALATHAAKKHPPVMKKQVDRRHKTPPSFHQSLLRAKQTGVS